MNGDGSNGQNLDGVVKQLQAQVLAMDGRLRMQEMVLDEFRGQQPGPNEEGIEVAPGVSIGTWLKSGRVVVNGVVNQLTLDLTKRYVVVNVRTQWVRQEAGPRPNPENPDEAWFDLFEEELHVTRFG